NSNQTHVNANTPILSNLSMDGKAWFIHPVAVVNYFPVKTRLWYEPLENPQRTYYNFYGFENPKNGAFGIVRSRKDKVNPKNIIPWAHAGLDIFADINTPCYACLDGEIVQYKNEGDNGYGNVLVLVVKGDDLRASRNEYALEFAKNGEIEQAKDFDINAQHFYLRYCHLSDKRADLKVGDMVKSGDLIGYTGDTGNARGCLNPHLHFEIAMKQTGNRSNVYDTQTNRLGFKINPAFFVKLQKINKSIQEEIRDLRELRIRK
ncbi:M23 family metallopeptidase, partial [Candidatus Schmidhempelia bombi]